MSINMPKGFRYKSSWEDFKVTIDFFKDALEENKARILYGSAKRIRVEIEEERYENLPLEEEDFIRIINAEFVGILNKGLTNSWETESLERYLQKGKAGEFFSEPDIEEIIRLVEKKYKYVVENFINREEINRYYFKQGIINDELAEIQFNINKYMIDNHNEVKYALVKLTTKKGSAEEETSAGKSNSIEFVGDVKDIERLIDELEEIKEKLSQ